MLLLIISLYSCTLMTSSVRSPLFPHECNVSFSPVIHTALTPNHAWLQGRAGNFVTLRSCQLCGCVESMLCLFCVPHCVRVKKMLWPDSVTTPTFQHCFYPFTGCFHLSLHLNTSLSLFHSWFSSSLQEVRNRERKWCNSSRVLCEALMETAFHIKST